jgi:signal peptidase II
MLEAEDDAAPGWRGKSLALWIALGIAVADLWSKDAVFAAFPHGEPHWVAEHWFGLQPVLNPGIMWGKFPELSDYLPWFRLVAAVVVLAMVRSTPAAARRMHVALGLVLGGALGNIWDGFSDIGKVRDFLLVDFDIPVFDPFPVFNVADSAICVGVGLLALGLLFDKPAPAK